MFGKKQDGQAGEQHQHPREPGDNDPGNAAESCCGGTCHGASGDTGAQDSHAGAWSDHAGPDATSALIDSLARERDEFKDKWLRAMAEYQNFQRRAIQNEHEAKRQGVSNVLMSVVPVLDSFDMALANAPKDGEAERGGVAMAEGLRAIQQSLLNALSSHGVSVIRPTPGDEFDPNRHSAIMQMPGAAPDGSAIEPGRVSQTLQVGYAINASGQERVIRSAKVAVVPSA